MAGGTEKPLRAFIMILCLQLNVVSGQEKDVVQSPSILNVWEKETAVFNCTYRDEAWNYFPWYKKEAGKGPNLLVEIRSNVDRKQDGRVTVLLNKKAKHVSLHIKATQPGDSALYLCAASMTPNNTGGSSYGKLTFGQGTVLTVYPIIHQPDPSVYKLRGPKSSNTSVCLLTDFASQDNVTQEMKHMVFRSGSTALDVKAMDSKSNGALAWSNSINFQCNSTFETYAFYPSSEYSCDAKLVEKSFETDMNLNFQNLSVIALRILLLKVAGFNLLMTLRLWSS